MRLLVPAIFEGHQGDEPSAVADQRQRRPEARHRLSTEFLSAFADVSFRPRFTFDTSGTPKVGGRRSEARTLASVALAAINDVCRKRRECASAMTWPAVRRPPLVM
ncbi:MAG: hypothetical protein ACRDZ8_02085 [Acidimicrobiales bacterium]